MGLTTHPTHTGIQIDWLPRFREIGGNFTTLPQMFKEHGYHSIIAGKIFHRFLFQQTSFLKFLYPDKGPWGSKVLERYILVSNSEIKAEKKESVHEAFICAIIYHHVRFVNFVEFEI